MDPAAGGGAGDPPVPMAPSSAPRSAVPADGSVTTAGPVTTLGPSPADVEAWLAALGIETGPRAERDGVVAWDVVLDGRRRRDLRTTLILDPTLGLITWAHLAPPIGDGLRKAYRALLRWNDEFPLAKFSIADDGRPILAVELPGRWLDADELGLALARVAGIADRLFDETRGWLWIGGRVPDGYADRDCRTADLLDRFAPRLPELFEE
jgi:Putative bacterial sensory transduction regulator